MNLSQPRRWHPEGAEMAASCSYRPGSDHTRPARASLSGWERGGCCREVKGTGGLEGILGPNFRLLCGLFKQENVLAVGPPVKQEGNI